MPEVRQEAGGGLPLAEPLLWGQLPDDVLPGDGAGREGGGVGDGGDTRLLGVRPEVRGEVRPDEGRPESVGELLSRGPGDGGEALDAWSWPTEAEVRALVVATWPEAADRALAVARCESGMGQHPRTFDLDASSGGPMQIERYWTNPDGTVGGWGPYFERTYGWTWEQVVRDLPTHFRAARIIYERAGGFGPWTCNP